jgi:hypothetical protein
MVVFITFNVRLGSCSYLFQYFVTQLTVCAIFSGIAIGLSTGISDLIVLGKQYHKRPCNFYPYIQPEAMAYGLYRITALTLTVDAYAYYSVVVTVGISWACSGISFLALVRYLPMRHPTEAPEQVHRELSP